MSIENPFSYPEKSNSFLEKTYDLESGVSVKVSTKEISPDDKKENSTNSTVVFLPGLEAGSEDLTTIEISKEFANASNNKALAIGVESKINSSQNKEDIDLFYEEALAIASYIKESGIKDVTIVGYSIGGDRGINLVSVLQNEKDINIKGLILLASTGLYEEKPRHMLGNLMKDSFVRTPKSLLKNKNTSNNFAQWFRVAADVGTNMIKKTISNPKHVGEIKRVIKESSDFNSRLGELNVPVVLLNGAEDTVSNPNKILSNYDLEQEESFNSREKYLKENVFTKSPYVKMIIPEKTSNHGLAFFRSESIAKASLYLIDRFYRDSSK